MTLSTDMLRTLEVMNGLMGEIDTTEKLAAILDDPAACVEWSRRARNARFHLAHLVDQERGKAWHRDFPIASANPYGLPISTPQADGF